MAYVAPIRNPLSRLPVRSYRGPLRNRLPGLSGIRKGLGDTFGPPMDVMGDLPLVGPYTNPSPVTAAQLGIAEAALNPNLPASSSGTLQSMTAWLNKNSSTLLWVGGIAAGILLLSRMAR